jgi:5-methylcytosine-specific restriction endonuclease McrA
MPICYKCKENKDLQNFARRGSGYRGICRPCHTESKLEWARRNKESRSASSHKYYAKKVGKHPDDCVKRVIDSIEAAALKKLKRRRDYEKNRKRYLERAKQYAQNHKEKVSHYQSEWRQTNAEQKKENDKKWRTANMAKLNSYYSARRDRRRAAEPSWLSAIEQAQIQEMYDVAAALTTQTGVKHHVDHIHPLKGRGFSGLHVPWNLQVLRATENLSKGTRLPANESHLMWGRMNHAS